MPAHLRDIPTYRCQWRSGLGCQKPATKRLFNTRNEPINEYCLKHARQALADFNKRREGES